MNKISGIIHVLSSEERKNFLSYLKQKNKRKDIKNIKLFRLLEKNPNVENLDVLLYGKKSKGAYHALSKRLYDSLIDFLSVKSFYDESLDEVSVVKLIYTSRLLYVRKEFNLAFSLLEKAEKTGLSQKNYSRLHEIYKTQLSYVHLHGKWSFEEVLLKYKRNKKFLETQENMNLFYATIQNEMSNSRLEVSNVISENLEVFNIKLDESLNYESIYKILQICNNVGNVSRNYRDTLRFAEAAFSRHKNEMVLKGMELSYQIQILYYMANTYFRIREFKKSRVYLDRMEASMKQDQKKFYNIFLPQYDLLSQLNLIFSGNLSLALHNFEMYNFKKNKNKIDYYNDLKLTQVIALFFIGKSREAYQVFNQFYHSDVWYTSKSGVIWVIKKNLIEILLLIELDYFELVESRIKSFRKKYREHLMVNNEKKILDFLALVYQLYNNPEIKIDKNFIVKANSLLQNAKDMEDVFTISFYAWLQAKINNTNLYETCLSKIKYLK